MEQCINGEEKVEMEERQRKSPTVRTAPSELVKLLSMCNQPNFNLTLFQHPTSNDGVIERSCQRLAILEARIARITHTFRVVSALVWLVSHVGR